MKIEVSVYKLCIKSGQSIVPYAKDEFVFKVDQNN